MQARLRGTWCARPSARSSRQRPSRSARRQSVHSAHEQTSHVRAWDRDAAGDGAVDLAVCGDERREEREANELHRRGDAESPDFAEAGEKRRETVRRARRSAAL